MLTNTTFMALVNPNFLNRSQKKLFALVKYCILISWISRCLIFFFVFIYFLAAGSDFRRKKLKGGGKRIKQKCIINMKLKLGESLIYYLPFISSSFLHHSS